LFIYFEILLIIIIASSLGSFFNVCIYRLPRKKSIVFPSSHCPSCSDPIPKWLNLPLIGFFLTQGRCRRCGVKIHWHYPLVEFLTAFLFLMLFIHLNFSFLFFKYSILISFFIIIFFIDIFHKIIPDVLSLPLIPLGILTSLHPANDISITSSIVGGLAAFLLFYLISLAYWKLTGKMGLGGGDIKLIAGIGTFIGIVGILFSILVSSVIAVIVILLIRHDLRKEFPFGPFLIIGTLLYIFLGYSLINWYLSLFLF